MTCALYLFAFMNGFAIGACVAALMRRASSDASQGEWKVIRR